jgi:hypothetical protein
VPSLDIEIAVTGLLWGSRKEDAFPWESAQSTDHTLFAAAKKTVLLPAFTAKHVTGFGPE